MFFSCCYVIAAKSISPILETTPKRQPIDDFKQALSNLVIPYVDAELFKPEPNKWFKTDDDGD